MQPLDVITASAVRSWCMRLHLGCSLLIASCCTLAGGVHAAAGRDANAVWHRRGARATALQGGPGRLLRGLQGDDRNLTQRLVFNRSSMPISIGYHRLTACPAAVSGRPACWLQGEVLQGLQSRPPALCCPPGWPAPAEVRSHVAGSQGWRQGPGGGQLSGEDDEGRGAIALFLLTFRPHAAGGHGWCQGPGGGELPGEEDQGRRAASCHVTPAQNPSHVVGGHGWGQGPGGGQLPGEEDQGRGAAALCGGGPAGHRRAAERAVRGLQGHRH